MASPSEWAASSARDETVSARLQREVEQLRGELESEVARVEELRGEVDALRERLAEPADPSSPAALAGQREKRKAADLAASLQWLDEALLLEAGLTPAEADALRERFEAIEMERLYLRDEAAREGWQSSHRYRKAVHELDASFAALRDEFGDEAYDWLLHASGRNNRVLVGDVLTDSPAGEAGLKSGDLIVRYDGMRIFSGRELQKATSEGEAGRLVVIEVERKGDHIRVYLPRGPLGIRMGGVNRRPSDTR